MLRTGGLPALGAGLLSRWIWASVALHLAVLGALLFTRAPRLTQAERPGDRNGHRLLLTYSPGSGAPASALALQKQPLRPPQHARAIAAPAASLPSAPAAPASANTEAATGADALGEGDVTLALQVLHPPPHPDLSQLPSGTRGDVIVDVVIDKTGRIAKFTMTHGLGHGVDEAVLATIQQWTFQPATRNGIPVASEQELLFHYERG